MQYIGSILFVIILVLGIGFFTKNVKKLMRNIRLGKDQNINDNKSQRWKNMAMIALGQSKMVRRPVSGVLHVVVFGTHRIGLSILPKSIYGFLIGTFEVLAVLVFISVIFFWTRRNIIKLARFWKSEMTSWPKNDGNYIL